ncbi:MAG: hypothetical protein IJU70_09440 [Lentisphaeria bacterium]|nr:hypothetical protein [Lentisphaeria bacterium]
MSSKVSFLSAFFGVCSGVSVFERLRGQSWGRTIFHVILLGVVCTLFITSGELGREKPRIRACAGMFASVFGDRVLNTPEGLVPSKDPARARSIVLPGRGLLCYFPAGKAALAAKDVENSLFFVFWAPRGFATAVAGESGTWVANTVTPGKAKVEFSGNRVVSTAELAHLPLTSPWKWELPGRESFTVGELTAAVTGVLRIGLAFHNLLLTVLLPFIYTAVFVGMFRLTASSRRPRCLNYAEFWKIGLYAGFPALAVASVFPALDLPLFSFSTVYMAGLVIYWLYVSSRFEREFAETRAQGSDHE